MVYISFGPVILQLRMLPVGRPTSLGGDDVGFRMEMYTIDAASAQAACIYIFFGPHGGLLYAYVKEYSPLCDDCVLTACLAPPLRHFYEAIVLSVAQGVICQ
jgi:hypothetical protein